MTERGCCGRGPKRNSKSFGKSGTAPSVIDQYVGSHSLYLYVCWCKDGCGCLRTRERWRRDFAHKV